MTASAELARLEKLIPPEKLAAILRRLLHREQILTLGAVEDHVEAGVGRRSGGGRSRGRQEHPTIRRARKRMLTAAGYYTKALGEFKAAMH